MVRFDDEGSHWQEYLVYSAADFFWLVETYDGWSRATVMPQWPTPGTPAADEVKTEKVQFKRDVRYTATVKYAAGAFNWRVAAGDAVKVAEFARGQTRLAAEFTTGELTWSRSVPLAFDQVRAWFGLDLKKSVPTAHLSQPPDFPVSDESNPTRAVANKFMLAILMLNLVPLLLNFSGSIAWILLGLAAVYLPSKYLDSFNEER
jgi:hypothetical protein